MAVKKILPIISYEELAKLTDEQLLEMLEEYNAAAIIQKNIEQAIKILINSLYGYLGSVFSRFYERYMAEGITLNGQTVIRTSDITLNGYMNELIGTEKDRVIYCDTDSLTFDSVININGKEITIGEYYDSISADSLINSLKDIKRVSDDVALSYNGKIVSKPVEYVMRHKVKKKLYRISTGSDHVDVTEDHSIMVLNENDELVEIKPSKICIGKHKIIKIIKD